jgi:N-methylhydantoinase B
MATTASQSHPATHNLAGGIEYDPIRAEVIRNRLTMVAEEMASTMIRTSGSPVLTEAKDFSAVIFDRKLEHVAFAGFVIIHIGSSLEGVRSVARAYGDDIHPYDAFIVNDVYGGGALHQGDVGIVSPLFWEDEHVGWAFSNAHMMDIGGMSPGGFAPVAFDVYGEALRFNAIRLVREGEWVRDIERIVVDNVRVPIVLSDLKSLTASNNTAQSRLGALLDVYGLEEYERYNEINKDLSEQVVRARLAMVPDGVYEAVDWVEYDARGNDMLQKVHARVIIKGTQMIVDLSDVDPQSPGTSNTGYGAIAGFVGTLAIFFLAWDAPLNAGLWRPLRLVMPDEGTLLNPQLPAATSCGHLESGSKANRAMWEALSKACALSEHAGMRARVQAIGGNSFGGNSWTGNDLDGHYTAFTFMDAVSVGGGAHPTADGLDIHSYETQLDNGIPDVEINEGIYPVLYLWRRINDDSGGPGQQRGGQGLDWAWIPHGSQNLTGTLQNAMPGIPSRGMLGAYPGGTNSFEIAHNAPIRSEFARGTIPQDFSLAQRVEVPANHVAGIPLPEGGAFRALTGGGSGMGDPLLRDPAAVAADVIAGFVSARSAAAAYGVVLTGNGAPDPRSTEIRRAAIRVERLGTQPRTTPTVTGDFQPSLKLSGAGDERKICCARCDYGLSLISADWKAHAVRRDFGAAERLAQFDIAVQVWSETLILLYEWYCPSCATMLETNLYPDGVAPIHDLHVGTEVTEPELQAAGARTF